MIFLNQVVIGTKDETDSIDGVPISDAIKVKKRWEGHESIYLMS